MKKIMLFMLAFVGLMMGSCTTEVLHRDPNEPVSKDGVLLKFTLPNGDAISRSRGIMPESGENAVNDLTVLFFESTTNGTGKFVGAYKTPSNLLPSGNQNIFSLEIESMPGTGLVKTNPYSILAFANMMLNMFATDADLDTFLTNIDGKTENEVMNYAIMRVQGVADDNTSMTGGIDIGNLPMSAQSKKEANVDVVDVQLIRTVARFDVANATTTHKIISVSVWNAFTQATVWEKGYMDYSQARTHRFYGRNIPAGQEYMRGGVYAFPNVSTSPDQNDTKTTCLIIGMQENGGGATTYYRVNIHSSESGQYLKRNNVYQLTVQKVSGAGENSEANAYVKGKVLLEISINSWDRDEDGLIIRDGDNLLAIPTRKARFSPEAEQRQYYVYTLGGEEAELELIKLDMPAGMDAWLGGAYGNDLFISVTDYSFDQRKGSIELRFAGMKGIIEVIQSGVSEKSLKLSHTTVPAYPAGSRTDMLGSNPIMINSSGSWTAEIFGTDFSFSMDDATANKLTGLDRGYINSIYSNAINGNVQSRTNFVLITLDEDPDNYRNVLVLTQLGKGGFIITPDNSTVKFNADMSTFTGEGNTNVFTMSPGLPNDDVWTVDLSGINADKFSVTVADATIITPDLLWKGNGTITVAALEENYAGTYSATMKITHNGINNKSLDITQDFYSLKATLTNTVAIPEIGDNREVKISTDANQPLAWTATLTGKPELVIKGFIPYFVGTDGKPIMNGANYATTVSGVTGTSVKVGMKGIGQDIRAEGAPEATLTVVLTDKPTVTATPVVIKQDPVKYYNIYGQSISATYATWNGADPRIAFFKNNLINSSKFGPSGVVYAQATPDIAQSPSATVVSNDTGANRKRLFNVNEFVAPAQAPYVDWAKYRRDPYVVFVMTTHLAYSSQLFTNIGFNGFTIVETNVAAADDRKITEEQWVKDTEIYKYLIGGNGPFGTVDVTNINFKAGDAANSTLANGAWPNTFIPLIRHVGAVPPARTDNCIMGIDPTLRIIWLGETEFFGSTLPGTNQTPDATAFMNNLQAWMIMTANYGDSFNEKFKYVKP